MPTPSRTTSTGEPRPKRHKIDIACDRCRERKVKCDGVRPACGNCLKRLDMRDRCKYSTSSLDKSAPALSARRPSHQNLSPVAFPAASEVESEAVLPARVTAVPSPSSTASRNATASQNAAAIPSPSGSADSYASLIDSMTTVVEDGTSTQQYFGSSSAGSFTRHLKAAIDARLGLTSTKSSAGTVALNMNEPPRELPGLGMQSDPNYVLPPRRQSDHLMHVYWRYVDPLYPFLDRNKWDIWYDGLFTGNVLQCNERVFASTLNVIFALSTQLMESLQPDQRESSSTMYFQRAQDLLRLNVWEPGSVELVQCLLLMSQYLQSTNNPHHTWMVVGSAIRTAQSLGLHLPETSAHLGEISERELLRRIWHGCILMDRMVSVTHGRPAMISRCQASAVPLPLSPYGPGASGFTPDEIVRVTFFVKSVELYEIINLIVSAFYSTQEQSIDFSPSEHGDEDMGTLMKLDKSLSDWEAGLPEKLRFGCLAEITSDICQRQAVILHIRFLQARLLLLRPNMSRFCLDQPTSGGPRPDNLRSRVMQQAASFCVTTAQSVIYLMGQFESHDGTVGLLPAWWYRTYYIYSAASILIAAQLRPDVFPAEEMRRSWDNALAVLQSLDKFGPSVHRCVAALNILSSKLLQQQGVHDPAVADMPRVVLDGEFLDGTDDLQGNGSNHISVSTAFPDLDLTGLSFHANDFSDLNMHVWELLNSS